MHFMDRCLAAASDETDYLMSARPTGRIRNVNEILPKCVCLRSGKMLICIAIRNL